MDAIVTKLRLDANALGAWLLGPLLGPTSTAQQAPCEVLASSVIDDSIMPPRSVHVEGEAFVDHGETRLYLLAVARGTLVVVFDERSSLGLIRLRARKAKTDLERLLPTLG